MTIEISKMNTKNQEKYLDECLTILTYIKKILNKPKLKIRGLTKLIFEASICMLLIYLLCIIIIFLAKANKTLLIIFVIIFLIFGYLCYMTLYKRQIELKELLNNNKKIKTISLFINTKNITKNIINTNNIKNSFTIKWENLNFILINKYSIFFIPKDTNIITPISIPTNQKEEVLKIIKKLKKESYIIDNSNVYTKYNSKNIITLIKQVKTDLEIFF